jgi:hypothetical protein
MIAVEDGDANLQLNRLVAAIKAETEESLSADVHRGARERGGVAGGGAGATGDAVLSVSGHPASTRRELPPSAKA